MGSSSIRLVSAIRAAKGEGGWRRAPGWPTVAFHHRRQAKMPIRTATVSKRIAANGQALHRAMMRRTEASGGDQPSEAEQALLEERRQLKEERDKRKAQALEPRPTALDRLVRTHHPEAKTKKVRKETQEAGETKKPKARRTRAEKHAEKAAALEAARRSPKTKPAK